jgi:hypothetical protein
VQNADRRHFDQLSLDQLDRNVFETDSDLGAIGDNLLPLAVWKTLPPSRIEKARAIACFRLHS